MDGQRGGRSDPSDIHTPAPRRTRRINTQTDGKGEKTDTLGDFQQQTPDFCSGDDGTESDVMKRRRTQRTHVEEHMAPQEDAYTHLNWSTGRLV